MLRMKNIHEIDAPNLAYGLVGLEPSLIGEDRARLLSDLELEYLVGVHGQPRRKFLDTVDSRIVSLFSEAHTRGRWIGGMTD